ncbi:hypothetical protein A946_05770 [Methylacidiphilum kamchatkense Kam1]|uniref:Uncharacterized protein n=1 Tax=Methylacidiphilum kamchatkense Kam1 TaxID=1202785 RepID=A0ABR4ZWJ7_9BACT|nr:hypothetical protein A946_05770 [Methylacidiphilum kamchatkense Kam1]
MEYHNFSILARNRTRDREKLHKQKLKRLLLFNAVVPKSRSGLLMETSQEKYNGERPDAVFLKLI